MKNAIEIRNLKKNFGPIEAVKGIALDIPKGSFFGFLGPNGAGKSTTLHMITGLCTPTTGSINILGHDNQTDYLECRKKIGLTPQEFNFDRFFSIEQILEFQGGYFGKSSKQAKQRAQELLKDLDLWDKRASKAPQLSGGMKRRLLLAKALVHDPDILILDEPTAGIDVELRIKFWEYLRKLNRNGTTIILTTHYLEEADKLCDQIAFIHEGRIVKHGNKKDVIGDMKNLEEVFLNFVQKKEPTYESSRF